MAPAGVHPSLRPSQNSRTPETPQRRDRHDESWVEISSQPSSSSLSSIGDEVIATSPTVGGGGNGSRRRRQQAQNQHRPVHHRGQGATTITSTAAAALISSSQDEYEETESEDDHFLTSSGEKLSVPTTPSRRVILSDTDTDDEDATALARRVPDSPPSFRPQPNAFTHPPAAAAFPPSHHHPHSAVRGPGAVRSLPPHQRSGAGPSFMLGGGTRGARGAGGVYQPDNDAALRASLTTLLSCAAAARGIPKDPKDTEGCGRLPVRPGGRVSPGDQPMELRLVQEADLLPAGQAATPSSPSPSAPLQSLRRANSSDRKSKRRSAAYPRATKKKRTTTAAALSYSEEAATLLNPTLLTWVVSAGVVVLVSVVGFGAGYVIGREVGRQEGMNGIAAAGSEFNVSSVGETAAGCGSEVIRGSAGGSTLRKFRWGTDIARSVVAS